MVAQRRAATMRLRPQGRDGRVDTLAGARAFSTTYTPLNPKVGTLEAMDGNTAAVHVAYAMSETSFIYPISPATSMG